MVQLLSELGSSIFAEVAQWKRDAIANGQDVIDLGIGSPDRPPSLKVRQTLAQAVLRDDMYAYPALKSGMPFREKAAEWMRFRFSVELDPKTEICTLLGSQDGLAHLAMAIAEKDSIAIVPDPGYPIYTASLALAGVQPYLIPLVEENDYLPQLEAIPDEVWKRTSFILLNYPNNPLTAVANLAFFEKLVSFANQKQVLIVHDLAYSEMGYDEFQPPSIMQIAGAKDIAVEFHSLSKSFNMAGCRIGFMVGQQQAVSALSALKANIDYGVFEPIQEAGIVALDEAMYDSQFVKANDVYQRRRDLFITELRKGGWNVEMPKATMFVWAKLPKLKPLKTAQYITQDDETRVPETLVMDTRVPDTQAVFEVSDKLTQVHAKQTDAEVSDKPTPIHTKQAVSGGWSSRLFAQRCLNEAGVVVIPGDAFGQQGEGYVRIALVESEARLLEAAERLSQFVQQYA